MNEDLKVEFEHKFVKRIGKEIYFDAITGPNPDEMWKWIEAAITKARADERKEISEQCLKETLMGGFNYHWHLGRDWIDRKQLVEFLGQNKNGDE